MNANVPITLPDANLLKEILKELKEDPDRLDTQIEAFKEWLKYEPHLPNNVDERLVRNFVRLCKCDLEKSKIKFEKFLAVRLKLRKYYSGRNFDENFFKSSEIHRQLVNHPDLTANGYRVGFFRFPQDPRDFDFDNIINYGLLMLDFLLFEDISAGSIIVYDLSNFTPQHLSKFNIRTLLEIIDIMYNISPFRIKEIHLLQVPFIAETVINVAKKILSQKMQKRIMVHKNVNDLNNFLAKSIVPDKYGGYGRSLDKIGDDFGKYFADNSDWISITEDLKLTGPIPDSKKSLYSFEECKLEGTFRQLSID